MYEETLRVITLPAGQDLSAAQFKFVTVASDGQVNPTGAGVLADGVLQNDPNAAGVPAAVAIGGVSRVVCGATVAAGALVMSNATGQAVTATTGNEVLGKALVAGVVNAIIPVLLKMSGRAPAA